MVAGNCNGFWLNATPGRKKGGRGEVRADHLGVRDRNAVFRLLELPRPGKTPEYRDQDTKLRLTTTPALTDVRAVMTVGPFMDDSPTWCGNGGHHSTRYDIHGYLQMVF